MICGCGTTFTPTDKRQRRCRKDCGRTGSHIARSRTRAEHLVEFVGVDGEGVTEPDGTHRYVLLSVGERSLHRDGATLSFDDICSFLWECFLDNPGAVYVGYFLGYDYTQWFRGLPEDRARMLLSPAGIASRQRRASGGNPTPFPVGWGPWEFDLHAGRRFKLRRKGAASWMYICDAGSFYQTSFINAIKPSNWVTPICTAEDYAVIERGKEQRSNATFDPAMVVYNTTENRVMAALMDVLNDGFTTGAGVRLDRRQWYGPGQAVQRWMTNVSGPTAVEIQAAVPDYALDAGRSSYYGGWFEVFQHGHLPGTTHEYDINSAYPYVIATLPCLLHGIWTHGTGRGPDTPWKLVHATLRGSSRYCGAAPHRQPHGSILRPNHTRGWHWWHELSAARDAGLIDTIRCHEYVAYQPCSCPPPYAGIADLYQLRLDVGKNTAAGKALKLLYNSAYGKCAQSVGRPRYACSLYASAITSGTRTQILQAIASHPRGIEDVAMVATDGVYFRTPHPTLRLHKTELGAWDHTEKPGLTTYMPGVYWDDHTRAKLAAGEHATLKSRGVSARDLEKVVTEADRLWNLWTPDQDWPNIVIPLEFSMVSARQALHRNNWQSAGTLKPSDTKKLNANPRSKRNPDLVLTGRPWRTVCYQQGHALDTTPYDKRFGVMLTEDEWDMGINPDGDIISLLAEALQPPEDW